ncbi:MAG: ABC transporter permease [Cyclobacteriaceae bacterium]|nr:ABC transporter permease [Cyclobacteriaceae bacterium]
MIETLYSSLGQDSISADVENSLLDSQSGIHEVTLTKSGYSFLPNASQHNVPAWTIFALFFMVISLGSNMVKEKQEGSFVRIKTLPTSYFMALLSKQITYMVVAIVQVFVIFSIGIWVFPSLDLPALNMPGSMWALTLVTVFTALSAISYAIFIGVFANTQEQANGIGAVSVVILAAIGGIMVPDFVMPSFIQKIMVVSPLHWCLEAYYELFLEGGAMSDIYISIVPLLFFSLILQSFAIVGLKRKNLI